MKPLLTMLAAVLFASFPSIGQAEGQEMSLGVYVVVSDLKASKEFYAELFQKEPFVENDDFVGFDVSGSLFGIYTETAYSHPLTRGTSAIPYIRVSDLEQEYERVAKLAQTMVHDEIVQDGPIELFMFTDPDGNAIEFYEVVRKE